MGRLIMPHKMLVLDKEKRKWGGGDILAEFVWGQWEHW